LTALISDIHGNRPALETAVADARERGARRFVCLGDVIGYGADPCACLELVMGLVGAGSAGPTGAGLEPGLCLLGNHEAGLLSEALDFNPHARAALDWTRAQIHAADGDCSRAEVFWDFLGALAPLAVEGPVAYAHGSPRDPVREYLLPRDARDREKIEALFHALGELAPLARVCFVGHSHVPGVFFEDGRYHRPRDTEGPYALGVETPGGRAIVNVGSVGQPRDGDARLSYALFDADGALLTFVRLSYDVGSAQAAIRAVAELPEFLAERLVQGR
jgi:diadenosine tetraphosphatase ApaH/serine/threonine PP2A family protein phosphatase